MSKDIEEKKLKKEKKDKKEKRAEKDGVTKSKKDKKEKKIKDDVEMTDALEAELEKEPEVSMVNVVDGASGDEPRGALVPFAFPLADNDKEVKKILKTVKKSAKSKTLRRGVKEVVKALRKSAAAGAASTLSDPSAIVVIAADISPMDVIAHIPVLCEDHNVPYIYIKSRAQLGEASATKRPTSVVMIGKDKLGKKAGEGDDEFAEAYAELVKVVAKASKTVRK
ncbi:50S ribosomal protein L30e-like protein [Bipolaris maydis]|nr:50S ribosomal protein L30e-like protein [Bipolaris maydis]KAJ5057557.1 50S ribosomal protein L30e-like protein [Bipolaris maydis]KAJ6194810.1 50S ribosomal protein L30e-like protein [Bipolaris maydis]KAJ6206865.1 50S ribosomal protein L30e-like protein [Bipolaris maydis]KAJ6268614.1 50S ribosomal protein L30e-like protein [Bipolaris maydis]